MLGVLREGTASPDPPYTLADLRTLFHRVQRAGTVVDAVIIGAPDQVPAAVSREAYRIVQEGLTNAMRHPGPITVRVSVGSDRLEVELTNPIASGAVTERGGRGLTGIAERVHVLRGVVTAGPVTDDNGRRWRLVASLPLSRS
ncbi:sensor histidine kinase [Dactylosporangium sp. CA-233914]|uniref:sensor histidine kinase n=1 Tax=Dactylosporangium sp. CA-233914 TaxID=3239934 RepID=UPI003D8E11A6